MPDERTILLIGYPESGKTTFLAALWQVLSVGEVKGSLKVERLSGNLAHLKTIHDAWLRCETATRTPREATEVVQMELTSDAAAGTLIIPDLAGDLIADYMADRAWPQSFDESVRSAAGLLLFVHAGNFEEGVRTEDAAAWTADVRDSPTDVDDRPASHTTEAQQIAQPSDFDPSRLPTQVMVVDLLQQLSARAGELFVTLIVSAWDVVPSGIAPREWLGSKMPLLAQYLAANAPDMQVFGVSALGGRLPEQAKELAAKIRPSDRILVTDGSRSSNDASWPIRLMLDRQAGSG